MAEEQMDIEEVIEDTTAEVVETVATEETVEATADAKTESDTLLSADGGDDAGDEADDKSEDGGVPDEYEFTPPDGLDLSEEVQQRLEEFKEFSKEVELTQDQFQKIIDYNFSKTQGLQEHQADAYAERINTWGEEVKADKEFGGEKLTENLKVVKKVLDGYGSEGFQKLLDRPSADNPDGLGLGNHPEIIRFLHRIGKSVGESPFIDGDGHKSSDGGGLQRMYPTMNQFNK